MLALGYSRSYSREHNKGSRRFRGTMHARVVHSRGIGERGETVERDVADDEAANLDRAVNGLCSSSPEFSAFGPLVPWQRRALICVPSVLLVFAMLAATGDGGVFAIGIASFITLPFLVIVLIRLAAIWNLAAPSSRRLSPAPRLAAADLPDYTVLVPLLRESEIVPALVQSMNALDYPHDRLEILFVTEAAENATRLALSICGLPPHMHILSVPVGTPQTKPRALSYAMQYATGSLVTVFDAEDVPAPDQLRRAAEIFADCGPDLACVQARLSIYNADSGFLTRQFALEYAALFEAILPLMQRLGLPILLGGTSNHFRRTALDAAGGWDPYNVTEDADLGVRFARLGRRVVMLDSDTWEEAPATLRDWLGQRTRWLKGWMQTYIVHMRSPKRLWRELGSWRFLGLQAVLGGMILSALVHPWFYVAAFYQVSLGRPLMAGGNLWMLCWFNLWAGYGAGIVLGLISAWRSQGRVPVLSALLVPIYWLAISFASYLAIWHFYVRPYHWQKTPHAARPVTSAALVP